MFKDSIEYNIAITYRKRRIFSRKPVKNMKRILEDQCKRLPPKHPEIATSYRNIATSYYNAKNYSKALDNYKQCHNIQKAILPSTHSEIAKTETFIKKIPVAIEQKEKVSKKVSKLLNLTYILIIL